MSASPEQSLAGKRTVVTGASRGIGRAIALALASEGATVAAVARDAEALAALTEEIRRLGREAVAIPCDVTDQARVEAMAATALDKLGGIDILVHNAGAAGSARFLGHDDELWHRMLAVNLTSIYYVSKAFAPAMAAAKSGRMITIASTAARIGAPYVAAYTAAKHGVLGLMRALAAELGPHGITVNTICPGYVDTPMTERTIANLVARTGRTEAKAREVLEATNPQRRLIDPEEVARLVVFLAQEGSAGITGQAINVDGGAVMS
ncbi:MAG: SDR family NAD(P)-dependent oxidoreductase [Chloroflexota bacterium]